uniref:Coiled-coil domain-containing protein 130 n=1 Tax=Octactis speculum TaxID=3111310 RepID=A0A7S2HCV6_9STRA
MGKGTRFNAKKERDGAYFSTKIWKFSMKCASCPQLFVIATDPKNSDYAFRAGIKKKVEEYDATPSGQAGTSEVEERVQEKLDGIYKKGGHLAVEERHRQQTDAICKLERSVDDKKRALSEGERFDRLLELGESRRHFDYDANAALRQTMRQRRREVERLDEERKSKGLGPGIRLLGPSECDATAAAEQWAATTAPKRLRDAPFLASERTRLLSVKTASIFGSSSAQHHRSLKARMLMSTLPVLGSRGSRSRLLRKKPKNETGTALPTTTTVKQNCAAKKKRKCSSIANLAGGVVRAGLKGIADVKCKVQKKSTLSVKRPSSGNSLEALSAMY